MRPSWDSYFAYISSWINDAPMEASVSARIRADIKSWVACAAPQTIMTMPCFKCSCNYKFRGAGTTMIFATNEPCGFRKIMERRQGFSTRDRIIEEFKSVPLKCQNNMSHYVRQTNRNRIYSFTLLMQLHPFSVYFLIGWILFK